MEFGGRDKERREEGRGNCDNDGKKLINKKMMKICCMKLSCICIILCFKGQYSKMLTVDSR